MISYSRLLWWKRRLELQLVACVRQAASTSAESLVPVDMRLALAQKIEVRTVEDEDETAHGASFAGAGARIAGRVHASDKPPELSISEPAGRPLRARYAP